MWQHKTFCRTMLAQYLPSLQQHLLPCCCQENILGANNFLLWHEKSICLGCQIALTHLPGAWKLRMQSCIPHWGEEPLLSTTACPVPPLEPNTRFFSVKISIKGRGKNNLFWVVILYREQVAWSCTNSWAQHEQRSYAGSVCWQALRIWLCKGSRQSHLGHNSVSFGLVFFLFYFFKISFIFNIKGKGQH